MSLGDSYADSPLYSREPLTQEEEQEELVEEEETESDEEMPIIDKIILKLENIIIRYETGVLPYQIIDLYRGDHNDAVDSCKIIVKLVLDGDSIDELINMKWDKLVTDLIECARLSLGDNIKGSEVDSRMLSVTLSGFMAIFQQPKIAQLISEKSLENLLQLSLKGLLGDTLQENDQLKDLSQAFQHVLIRVLQSANTTLLLAAICQTLYLTSIREKYVEQKLQVVLKMLDKIRHAEAKHSEPYSKINCEIFIPSLNKVYGSFLYKRYQNSMDLTLDDLLRDYVESQYELLQTQINKFSLQDVLYTKIMNILQPQSLNNNNNDNNEEDEDDEENDSIIRLQEILQNITQEIMRLQRKEITSCPTIPILYEFKQQHPQINIDSYLEQLGAIYSGYIQRELETISSKERTMNLTNNYLQSNTALDVKERLKQLKSQYNLPVFYYSYIYNSLNQNQHFQQD